MSIRTQCLTDATGASLLANAGIPRISDGTKRDLHLMAPSLVRLDGHTGELLGQWCLPDPRLSLRHLAWSCAVRPDADVAIKPLLGVARQAEHDDPSVRNEAPTLAVRDGNNLRIPTCSILAGGYADDIAAAVSS